MNGIPELAAKHAVYNAGSSVDDGNDAGDEKIDRAQDDHSGVTKIQHRQREALQCPQ